MFLPITGIYRQILISSCVYIGQMMIGFTTSWPGPMLPKLEDLDQSPLPYILSSAELSLVASFIYIGGIPGPYVMGWLSNVKGRKPCLIIGGVMMSAAYIILASSQNLAMLYCGRIMSGLGIGITGVMNLVYIGEIASTNLRGILLTNLGIFTTVGSILMFAVGPYLSFAAATSVGAVVSITFTVLMLFIPESPMFYVLKGDEEQLRRTLLDLGRPHDIDILVTTKKEYENTSTKKDWIELFTKRNNRKALMIVVIINVFQHCSGVITVINYSAAIFRMAGSSIDSNIAMIVIGCFQLCGSGIAPFFIERSGRRTLMSVSSVLTSVSMLILGLYFYFDYIGSLWINDVRWLPLFILIIYFVAYDFGLGVVPNTLLGEMFTTNVRSKGSAVAMSASWVSGFVVTTIFGAILEIVGGHVAFWFFACACAGALLFSLYFIPETKGKSLIEIQKMTEK